MVVPAFLYERVILVLGLMWCVGVVLVLWHVDRLQTKLVASAAHQGAFLQGEMLEEFRTLYTAEVVERLRGTGIEVTHEYRTRDAAIPLPATFTIELGERIGHGESGQKVRLYSDAPFPWRADRGMDDFEREALAHLRQHPQEPFMRFDTVDGTQVLRYAVADVMRAECVACHNNHPASPRKDWKRGDVRGVLEISRPLGPVLAATRTGLRETFLLIAAISCLALSGLGLVVGKVRRMSAELEERLSERTRALREREQTEVALRESEARYRTLVEHAPEAIVVLDAETGVFVDANANACLLFGVPQDELRCHGPLELSPPLQPDGRSSVDSGREKILEALAGGSPRFEWVHRNALGQDIPCEVFLVKLPSAKRQLIRGSIVNVSDRKRAEEEVRRLNVELEERVRQRTAQLEAVNKELEAFSYSVSHDLRSPLRAINGFSQILFRDHADHLPPAATRCLQRIRANTVQMGELIDDLLAFSRLGRQSIRKATVHVAALVRQALADLRGDQEGRNVDIRVSELPDCQSDPALLKQVFANLIGNALKYTRKRDPAVIAIGCRPGTRAGETVFFVQDNGAGFDMRYAHKLFGVFQRLHRTEDYEGTGVGLAIVQRIIGRLGGRVWAEAEVDRGATFFFTLDNA